MKCFAPPGEMNVFEALALENCLLNTTPDAEALLFCWIGEPAVVMGKNQNPWRECNLELLQAERLKLARRVSGGGAVYHDPGNLNIAWILPREGYRPETMHDLLIRALARLDIQAVKGAGGSVRVAERKISGSAFCYRREKVLHHGTLLLNADLDLLRSALSPRQLNMQTHAVPSVPAPVVNLTDLDPGLNREKILEALLQEGEACFGRADQMGFAQLPETWEAEKSQFAAPAWIWDQTPGFASQLTVPDGRNFIFRVRKGRIVEAEVGGERLEIRNFPRFPDGDFGEIEEGVGIDPGILADLLSQAGWVRF
ncbi:MAG: lipoate--protein ligase family protein [Kiritimatiellia bacterium]